MTRLLIAATVGWAMISGIALLIVDSGGFAVFGFGLVGVTAIAVLASRAGRTGLVYAVIAGLLFAAVQLLRPGTQRDHLLTLVVGVLCFMVIALISGLLSNSLTATATQMQRATTMLEELSIRDEETGALKRTYAGALVVEEIERSRRYSHRLTVLLVGFDRWAEIVRERGEIEARLLLKQVATVIIQNLRVIDKVAVFAPGEFAVLLPETPVDGAQAAGQKLVTAVQRETGMRPRIGIAEYPNDAITSDLLWREAEAALAFARSADLPVASRSLLA